MKAEPCYWTMAWALAAAVVATHLLGASACRAGLWGGNLYGFLPGVALVGGSAVLLVALLSAARDGRWLDHKLLALRSPEGPETAAARLRAVVIAIVFHAGFWLFRERLTMLGDGNALAVNLPRGQSFHPQEPLTLLIHHWFYRLTRHLFESGARDPAEVARDTVGLSSALAGVLFVPVAWGIARDLARSAAVAGGGGREPAGRRDPDRAALVPLFFLLILSQGYVQLFFGYVENYTFYTVALGAYLLAALRFLGDRAPLLLPVAALVLALTLHLSALALVPSCAVLILTALTWPGRRLAAARDLALGAALFALADAGLARSNPGYALAGAVRDVLRTLGAGALVSATDYRLLSWRHVGDFMNEQLLIGPVGLALFLTAAAATLAMRSRPGGRVMFAFVAGLGSLAACWIASDSNLGYARNWDLLAPAGLAFCAAGLVLAARSAWRPVELRRWLFVLIALSLFHTMPWVAVNASFARSFARFETLPLGLGRAEGVVGGWYADHADTAQAIQWLERSLRAYSGNNVAAYSLGRIAVSRGEYRRAAQSFWTAVQSRPDVGEYRFSLVDAIVRGGGPPRAAEPHLDTLLTREPRQPVYWAAYGVVCLGLGRRDRAAACFARAQQLAPAEPGLRALMDRVREPDGYARAVREDWPAWMRD